MQAVKSKRWRIVGAVTLLFGLGFLAGVLSMNLYQRHETRLWPRREGFEQALKQLNLNAEQQTKVDAILADTRNQLRDVRKEESPRVSDIRKQARGRLQSVLTPEQWRQLQEKMRSSRGNQGAERSSLIPNDGPAQ